MRTQQWHRLLGISSALSVLLLAITGILLNHTHYFELHKRHIESLWLLSWYGYQVPDKILSFQSGDIVVSQLNQQIYFDQTAIFQMPEQMIGSVYFAEMIIIADNQTLYLYTLEGELIENIEIPKNPTYIGQHKKQPYLIVATSHGNFQTDASLLQWQKTEQTLAEWASPIKITDDLKKQLNRAYLGLGIDVERVILDLHSGRFFGKFGPWFMDIFALTFCFLAMSGIILWSQTQSRKTKRQKKKKKDKNGQKTA